MFTLIALGGNLPHGALSPRDSQVAAIAALQELGFIVVKQSNFYQTPAFPAGSGPDYINSATQLLMENNTSAAQLLGHLAAAEAALGRTRAQRWGGRTLDLDLLAFGDCILPDLAGFRAWADLDTQAAAKAAPDQLILPHPRLHERAFVLAPLMDIAPDWRHPVFGKSVRDMYAALPLADRASVIALTP